MKKGLEKGVMNKGGSKETEEKREDGNLNNGRVGKFHVNE